MNRKQVNDEEDEKGVSCSCCLSTTNTQKKKCFKRKEELDTLKAKIIDEIEGNLKTSISSSLLTKVPIYPIFLKISFFLFICLLAPSIYDTVTKYHDMKNRKIK